VPLPRALELKMRPSIGEMFNNIETEEEK